jgi:hypothetical protein
MSLKPHVAPRGLHPRGQSAVSRDGEGGCWRRPRNRRRAEADHLSRKLSGAILPSSRPRSMDGPCVGNAASDNAFSPALVSATGGLRRTSPSSPLRRRAVQAAGSECDRRANRAAWSRGWPGARATWPARTSRRACGRAPGELIPGTFCRCWISGEAAPCWERTAGHVSSALLNPHRFPSRTGAPTAIESCSGSSQSMSCSLSASPYTELGVSSSSSAASRIIRTGVC